jgi:uncharacterized protein (TIGR01777 family)
VTGATGFLGRHLLRQIDHGVVLTRSRAHARDLPDASEVFEWSPPELPPSDAFSGVEVVFHLAGDPISGGRWTEDRKRRILESRREGTRALVDAIAGLETRPRALISASAVGYYGDRGEEKLTEASPAGSGFLAEVASHWEKEAMRAESLGVRTVCVRTGLVMGDDGGMLAKLKPLFQLGLGPTFGSGQHWMPWVHRDDIIRLYLHAAAQPDLHGPVNGVAPGIVRNREFTRTLARVLGRPTFLRAPAFAIKAAMGEMAELVLGSQRVEPAATLSYGFRFAHPELEPALRDLLSRR